VTRLARAALCAAALGLASPAAAAITVETFLAKIAGLKKKGPLALFSGDIGVLKRESAAAVAGMESDKKARAAAGRPPLFCAPASTKMSAGEMIAGLQSIPPGERRIPLQDGFSRVIARKYPCS
jgi:hypothetical protein